MKIAAKKPKVIHRENRTDTIRYQRNYSPEELKKPFWSDNKRDSFSFIVDWQMKESDFEFPNESTENL